MSIYLHKNIDINKIIFDKIPYEKYIENNSKIIHYIDISYNKDDLYIQIPKGKLVSFDIKDKIITVETNIDSFINKLETLIINTVYKYSTRWFNGKQFTINKIKNCILSKFDKNILYLKIEKIPSLYDQYKNILNVNELLDLLKENSNINIICIVKLSNLQFIDNKFTYNLELEQAKIYRKSEIKEYSIIESESKSSKKNIESIKSIESIESNENVTLNISELSSKPFFSNLEINKKVSEVSEVSELEDEYYKE